MHPLLRFTLDLFEPNQPLTLVDKAQKAIKKIAKKAPEKPPASRVVKPVAMPKGPIKMPQEVQQEVPPMVRPVVPGIVHFQHPRASREVRLGHALVAYEFKRGQRRSIGFSVGAEGLAVRAPKWVTLSDVDVALQAKSAWILRKLQETRERHARLATQVIEWRDGASLPFLGQMVTIRLDPEHRFGAASVALLSAVETDLPPVRAPVAQGSGGAMPVPAVSAVVWAAGSAALGANAVNPKPVPSTLWVSLPSSASPAQIKDMVQAWLMRQATQVFKERLDHFAPQLGVQWKKLSLSNAGTRWGSARVDGSIRLNWRLIHLRLSVLDYVVAHELSHLRVMDHSPRFWDTVRSVVPDYAVLRKQLKDEAAPR